eukprot:CAMPEP_0203763412 /NCGR_PEP_ID=MMETSP0098-20131031/16153_1 /ASSEMBLY_ACC=CAM_ASM_000208 /TAXON_ID=96639 /ORGANISM=" , Strain NY0313808BC1" /LENGTH=1147 /DNA_ID=CAMNT_0050658211 /DNA_START=706 /DNA_END=4146 /DNA_ORIENTATION=-
MGRKIVLERVLSKVCHVVRPQFVLNLIAGLFSSEGCARDNAERLYLCTGVITSLSNEKLSARSLVHLIVPTLRIEGVFGLIQWGLLEPWGCVARKHACYILEKALEAEKFQVKKDTKQWNSFHNAILSCNEIELLRLQKAWRKHFPVLISTPVSQPGGILPKFGPDWIGVFLQSVFHHPNPEFRLWALQALLKTERIELVTENLCPEFVLGCLFKQSSSESFLVLWKHLSTVRRILSNWISHAEQERFLLSLSLALSYFLVEDTILFGRIIFQVLADFDMKAPMEHETLKNLLLALAALDNFKGREQNRVLICKVTSDMFTILKKSRVVVDAMNFWCFGNVLSLLRRNLPANTINDLRVWASAQMVFQDDIVESCLLDVLTKPALETNETMEILGSLWSLTCKKESLMNVFCDPIQKHPITTRHIQVLNVIISESTTDMEEHVGCIRMLLKNEVLMEDILDFCAKRLLEDRLCATVLAKIGCFVVATSTKSPSVIQRLNNVAMCVVDDFCGQSSVSGDTYWEVIAKLSSFWADLHGENVREKLMDLFTGEKTFSLNTWKAFWWWLPCLGEPGLVIVDEAFDDCNDMLPVLLECCLHYFDCVENIGDETALSILGRLYILLTRMERIDRPLAKKLVPVVFHARLMKSKNVIENAMRPFWKIGVEKSLVAESLFGKTLVDDPALALFWVSELCDSLTYGDERTCEADVCTRLIAQSFLDLKVHGSCVWVPELVEKLISIAFGNNKLKRTFAWQALCIVVKKTSQMSPQEIKRLCTRFISLDLDVFRTDALNRSYAEISCVTIGLLIPSEFITMLVEKIRTYNSQDVSSYLLVLARILFWTKEDAFTKNTSWLQNLVFNLLPYLGDRVTQNRQVVLWAIHHILGSLLPDADSFVYEHKLGDLRKYVYDDIGASRQRKRIGIRLTEFNPLERASALYFATDVVQADTVKNLMKQLYYQEISTMKVLAESDWVIGRYRKWTEMSICDEDLTKGGLVSETTHEVRGEGIVIGSLVSKLPNLAGLTRTCDVFNVAELTMDSVESTRKEPFYKEIASSADSWMPLSNVPIYELKDYIRKLQSENYLVIALEQTADSKQITEYTFPPDGKVAFLLGMEKQGVPVHLIHMVDECIEIPQLGLIRSLNVHASASILLW